MTNIMIKTKKISISLVLAGVFAVFLFPRVNVDAEIPANVSPDDSVHQYNALENTQPLSLITANANGQEPSVNIPEALRVITEKEDTSLFVIESAMAELGNASEVKTFLIGNSLGILKFQLVQIRDEAIALQTLAGEGPDITTSIQINNQESLLKGEETKVEKFILDQESKFSLFGWFTKLL